MKYGTKTQTIQPATKGLIESKLNKPMRLIILDTRLRLHNDTAHQSIIGLVVNYGISNTFVLEIPLFTIKSVISRVKCTCKYRKSFEIMGIL